MKLHVGTEPIDEVTIGFTETEARELRDALDELLATAERGWHQHVYDETFWRGPGEGHRVERSVTVYRADDDTLAPPFRSP